MRWIKRAHGPQKPKGLVITGKQSLVTFLYYAFVKQTSLSKSWNANIQQNLDWIKTLWWNYFAAMTNQTILGSVCFQFLLLLFYDSPLELLSRIDWRRYKTGNFPKTNGISQDSFQRTWNCWNTSMQTEVYQVQNQIRKSTTTLSEPVFNVNLTSICQSGPQLTL